MVAWIRLASISDLPSEASGSRSEMAFLIRRFLALAMVLSSLSTMSSRSIISREWQPVVATHRIHESTKESPDVIDTLMRGRLLQVLFEHLEPAFCDPQLQAVAILEALNQGGSAEAYFRGNVRQGRTPHVEGAT